jgi:hypothetical protein
MDTQIIHFIFSVTSGDSSDMQASSSVGKFLLEEEEEESASWLPFALKQVQQLLC